MNNQNEMICVRVKDLQQYVRRSVIFGTRNAKINSCQFNMIVDSSMFKLDTLIDNHRATQSIVINFKKKSATI